jgi:hypothetical protein
MLERRIVRADRRLCMDLAADGMALAERCNDPGMMMEALFIPGVTMFCRGQFAGARACHEQALAAFDDRARTQFWTAYTGHDASLSECIARSSNTAGMNSTAKRNDPAQTSTARSQTGFHHRLPGFDVGRGATSAMVVLPFVAVAPRGSYIIQPARYLRPRLTAPHSPRNLVYSRITDCCTRLLTDGLQESLQITRRWRVYKAGRAKSTQKTSFSTSGEVTERPKVQHWKCCVGQKLTAGSNPALSAGRNPPTATPCRGLVAGDSV